MNLHLIMGLSYAGFNNLDAQGADMVVLSGSPLESLDVRELLVERTFIGGAEVYTRR